MFVISNKLEQLEFKLEKIIGILKSAGKVRKNNFKVKRKRTNLEIFISGKRSSGFEGFSGTDIWDPKTAILANMICTRNVGQKLKSDVWLLCATLYPFGGTGRIQYVTRGRGEYEVTYLFDPTWTYRLNHRCLTDFNPGFLLYSYFSRYS